MSFTPASINIANSNVTSSEDDDDFEFISCHNDRNEFAHVYNDENIRNNATTQHLQQNNRDTHNNNNSTMLFAANNVDITDRHCVLSLYENEAIPLVNLENKGSSNNNNTKSKNNENKNINNNNTYADHDNNKTFQRRRSNNSNSSCSSSEFIEICGSTPKCCTLSRSEAEICTDTPQSYRDDNCYSDDDSNYGKVNTESVKGNNGIGTKTSASESSLADEEETCMTRVHSILCLDANTQEIQQTINNSQNKDNYNVPNTNDHDNNNRSENSLANEQNEQDCHYKETITRHPSAPSESEVTSTSSRTSSSSSSLSSSSSEEQRHMLHATGMRSRAQVTHRRRKANQQ